MSRLDWGERGSPAKAGDAPAREGGLADVPRADRGYAAHVMKRLSTPLLVGLIAGALTLGAVPALAQEVSPAPGESAPASERRDLYLDMPYYMGGFEPEIVMTRGAEHFANLDAEDQARLGLESLLESVGADIDDMVSGYALVSQEDFFSFVVGIRVEGIEPGSLMPAYLPILYDDLIDPTGITGNVGGKDVVVIASVGNEDEYVELFVYDQGDTLWMVQGPKEVVETTLENLPDPI